MQPHHLLLACFAFDTFVAGLLQHSGWVYENLVRRLKDAGIASQTFPDVERPARPGIELPAALSMSTSADDIIVHAHRLEGDAYKAQFFRDYPLAILLSEAVIHYDSESEFAWAILAESLEAERQWIKAAEAFRRTYAIQADYGFLLSAAHNLAEGGENDAARSLYSELLQSAPDDPDVPNGLGFLFADEKKWTEAVACYDKAVLLDPDHAFALNNRGFALYRLGEKEAGYESITDSLTIDRGNAYAWRNLAVIALETGDRAKAKRNADKAFLYHYRRDFGDDLDALLNN